MGASMVKKCMIPVAFVLVAAVGVGLVKFTPHKPRRLARTPRSGQVYYGTDNSGAPFAYRYRRPARVPVTSVQSNAVAKAFEGVARAYVEGDGKRMRACMESLPDVVTNMPDKLFTHLVHPISEALCDGFINPRELLKDFVSVADFEEYLRNSIDIAVFWGNSYAMREDFASPVEFLDVAVLRKLLIYKERFRNAGRPEMEKCADRFIQQWQNHIESEDGFTRKYMLFQVDLQWCTYKCGDRSLEQLSAFVKGKANGLIRLGYTPKWLSEFDDLSEAVK